MYERKEIYPIEDVLKYVEEPINGEHQRVYFDSDSMAVTSFRYIVY